MSIMSAYGRSSNSVISTSPTVYDSRSQHERPEEEEEGEILQQPYPNPIRPFVEDVAKVASGDRCVSDSEPIACGFSKKSNVVPSYRRLDPRVESHKKEPCLPVAPFISQGPWLNKHGISYTDGPFAPLYRIKVKILWSGLQSSIIVKAIKEKSSLSTIHSYYEYNRHIFLIHFQSHQEASIVEDNLRLLTLSLESKASFFKTPPFIVSPVQRVSSHDMYSDDCEASTATTDICALKKKRRPEFNPWMSSSHKQVHEEFNGQNVSSKSLHDVPFMRFVPVPMSYNWMSAVTGYGAPFPKLQLRYPVSRWCEHADHSAQINDYRQLIQRFGLTNRYLFIEHLPKELTRNSNLMDFLVSNGLKKDDCQIEMMSISENNISAHVAFKTKKGAKWMSKVFHDNFSASGVSIEFTGPRRASRTLWIGNIGDLPLQGPPSQALGELVRLFGGLHRLRFIPEKNCAFATYETVARAVTARNFLHGLLFGIHRNQMQLNVDFTPTECETKDTSEKEETCVFCLWRRSTTHLDSQHLDSYSYAPSITIPSSLSFFLHDIPSVVRRFRHSDGESEDIRKMNSFDSHGGASVKSIGDQSDTPVSPKRVTPGTALDSTEIEEPMPLVVLTQPETSATLKDQTLDVALSDATPNLEHNATPDLSSCGMPQDTQDSTEQDPSITVQKIKICPGDAKQGLDTDSMQQADNTPLPSSTPASVQIGDTTQTIETPDLREVIPRKKERSTTSQKMNTLHSQIHQNPSGLKRNAILNLCEKRKKDPVCSTYTTNPSSVVSPLPLAFLTDHNKSLTGKTAPQVVEVHQNGADLAKQLKRSRKREKRVTPSDVRHPNVCITNSSSLPNHHGDLGNFNTVPTSHSIVSNPKSKRFRTPTTARHEGFVKKNGNSIKNPDGSSIVAEPRSVMGNGYHATQDDKTRQLFNVKGTSQLAKQGQYLCTVEYGLERGNPENQLPAVMDVSARTTMSILQDYLGRKADQFTIWRLLPDLNNVTSYKTLCEYFKSRDRIGLLETERTTVFIVPLKEPLPALQLVR